MEELYGTGLGVIPVIVQLVTAALTIRLKEVCLFKESAKTVTGYVPPGVMEEMVIVKLELAVGEEGLLENEALAPAGKGVLGEIDKVTGEQVPDVSVLLIVFEPVVEPDCIVIFPELVRS